MLNVIPVSGPNTLPVIYDRGLIGVMHDWYELNNVILTHDMPINANFLRNGWIVVSRSFLYLVYTGKNNA